jgi:hypothetical protein
VPSLALCVLASVVAFVTVSVWTVFDVSPVAGALAVAGSFAFGCTDVAHALDMREEIKMSGRIAANLL